MEPGRLPETVTVSVDGSILYAWVLGQGDSDEWRVREGYWTVIARRDKYGRTTVNRLTLTETELDFLWLEAALRS